MKITRYAHSCLLIEVMDQRILVDPGVYNYDESWLETDWQDINIILLTHKHQDHCHLPALKHLAEKGAKIYSTKEVQETYSELKMNIIKEGEVLNISKKLKITVTKALHGYFPGMPGTNLKECVGYIIDDGKKAYVTGDTISFPNNYQCDIIFLPMNNHGIVLGPEEGAIFAKESGASIICPIHGESEKFPTDWKKVKMELEKNGLNYKILKLKESLEI